MSQQKFCNLCKTSKDLSEFNVSRIHSGRKQCKMCIHKYNTQCYADNKIYEKNTRKLRRILENAFGVENAVELINPYKIRKLIESNGIDVANCKDVTVFPPKDLNDIEDIKKYQIVTY